MFVGLTILPGLARVCDKVKNKSEKLQLATGNYKKLARYGQFQNRAVKKASDKVKSLIDIYL